MNEGKKVKKILEGSHKFHKKHWVAFLFFEKLAGVWFSLVITFWGNSLYLTKDNGSGQFSLTFFGVLVTIGILCFNLYFVVAERYYELYNEDAKEKLKLSAEKDLYEKVSGSFNSICRLKMDSQLQHIKDLYNGPIRAESVFTNPNKQLKNIADQFIDNVAFLSSDQSYRHEKGDFLINVSYCFPKEDADKWYIADGFSDILISSDNIVDERSILKHLSNQIKTISSIIVSKKLFKKDIILSVIQIYMIEMIV